MHRRFLLAASLLALAACGQMPQPQTAARSAAVVAPAKAAPAAWPHLSSDLPVDPAVRFGRLPNGMRYAIMKNATPVGEASLRLRIDAGSLNERDDQRGIAHFLEHMVLNGTKNVPEGEFVRRLERAGLRFGPDTNASTDFEQTVFKLDLPKNDDATIGEAISLLREVADEASLEAAAIDSERGIILSEERARGNPSYRVALDEYGYVLKGQRLPTRFPIGDPEIIRTAQRERFLDFYNGYYRPERATLIAVGDFNVDQMEARIRAGFSGWTGEGPALPDADQGRPGPRATEARLFVQAGVPSRVSLNWVRPADTRPDTAARRRESTIEQLALRVLNRRLERIAAGANPPFAGAGAGISEDAESAERTSVVAVSAPGKWREALTAITAEQRRLVRFGVTPGELQREVVDLRSSYTTQAAGAATRSTRGLAEGLVAAVNDDQVVTTPASQLARFEAVVRGLTADAVNAALPTLFAGSGPLIYMTSPTPVAGDDRALLAAFDAAAKTPVTAPVSQAAKTWPYQSFGAPGTVVERRELADFGATAVRFANGTRLTVKQTKFKDDEVLVHVRFGAGRQDLRNDGRATPEWGAGSAVVEGGLGKLTWEEIKETLTPNVVGSSFGVGQDHFSLNGATRPQDFALQMKLLAAYFTDPAWRPEGWERGRSLADTVHDGLEATPNGVFSRDAGQLLVGGDSRWATPTRAEMKGMSIAAAREAFAPHFRRGPVEVVIVGDIAPDEAIRQVAATFGALPAGDDRPPAAPRLRFPNATATPIRLLHKGRADQGMAFIAWPTTDFYADMREARSLSTLAEVLQLRLTEEIREKQGTAYSPAAGHSPSYIFDDYGYLSATIQASPDKLAGFLADAERIARELRERPVTADELDRARRPTLALIARSLGTSNQYWLGNLAKAQTDPRVAAQFRSQIPDIEAVTPADLQRVARRYLADGKAWKLVVVPEPGAQPSSGAPAAK